MCGIFALLNNETIHNKTIMNEFMKGKNRGPEFSKLVSYIKINIGFHRLAINGLNHESNQPFDINDIILVCNGEIYNYKELYEYMNITPKTSSDCEVIIYLYLNYGIEQTLKMLDGVYSFILYDNRINDSNDNKLYIARDPLGVRPLYFLKNKSDKSDKSDNFESIYNDYTGNYYSDNHENKNIYGFASELKCLSNFVKLNKKYVIEQFKPGTYSIFNLSEKVMSQWEPIILNTPYYISNFSYTNMLTSSNYNYFEKDIFSKISYYLSSSVNKRCIVTERPIACLLSGGLDSSLIASLVNDFYKKNNYDKQLETYSIGLPDSEDLKHARIVSDYLGTKHTEIIVSEKEMFNAIPEVIHAIESYDTTTIRASIGNYLLGKYIKENSDAKVIFNGDGSDELCGGYLYMNKCPDNIEFDKEIRRLLEDIHLFDVLRSDKCISSHGLEPRTPFLDKSFVNYYLSIPLFMRNHNNNNKNKNKNKNNNNNKICEKYLLRKSFSYPFFKNIDEKQLLPDEILWRRKEAFSDGVSNEGRSLFTILQEQIAEKLQNDENKFYNISIETEKYYYKKLFDEYYPGLENILPYFWMPKYTESNDPSARTLKLYTEK